MAIKLKIFVINTASLELRKPMIQSFFEKLKLQATSTEFDVEWLTSVHEPNALDPKIISEFIKLGKNEEDPAFDMFARNLHIKQVSNVLKHAHALKLAADQASQYDFFLVIEDDLIFVDEIGIQLEKFMKGSESSLWKILFLGQPSTKDYGQKAGEVVLRQALDNFKILPCCDSYLLKSSDAKLFAEKFVPIRYSTTIQWSFVLNKVSGGYACVPNLTVDGSKFGVYISTLEPNSKLFMNPDYNKLQQLMRDGDYDKVLEQIENIKFKTHPDIVHMMAQVHKHKRDYDKAVELMETAYNLYKNNNAIVNSDSEFLKEYISIHQHMQKDISV